MKFSNAVLWFNSLDLMLKIKGVLGVFEVGELLQKSNVGPDCVIHSCGADIRILPGLAAAELFFPSCTCLTHKLVFSPFI